MPGNPLHVSGNGTWSDWFKLALIDSNETIAANGLLLKSNANLQFAGNSSSSVPNYSFQVSNFAKGDTPAKSFTTRYYLYDQNNNAVAVGALAGLELGVLEDGTTQASLIAFRNQAGVSSNQRISIRCKPDGSAITSTPHPVTSSHFLRSKSLRKSVFSSKRSPCAWHKGCSSSCARKSPWLMGNQDSTRHYQHSQKNSRSRWP